MFIISKIIFFLGVLVKSAYILPGFILFSPAKRKMFKPSEGFIFFLLVTATAISWRFAYTALRLDSAIASRYISVINLFLMVLAVPGMYAIVEIVHKLLSRFYKAQRKYIWGVLLGVTIIASLANGLKFREEKNFLLEVGADIEQICKRDAANDFVMFEDVGEDMRLAYYSPFLNNKIVILEETKSPIIKEITDRIKKDYKDWDKTFVFTREKKKKTTLLQDWNLFTQKEFNTKKIPFKIIKKYSHRKYYYYILEFNLNCLKSE